MDRQLQLEHCAESQLSVNDSKTKCLDYENGIEAVHSDITDDCSMDNSHYSAVKYACYANGVTKLTDSADSVCSSNSPCQSEQNSEASQADVPNESPLCRTDVPVTVETLPSQNCSSEASRMPASHRRFPDESGEFSKVEAEPSADCGKAMRKSAEDNLTGSKEKCLDAIAVGRVLTEPPNHYSMCGKSDQQMSCSPQPLDYSMTGSFAKTGSKKLVEARAQNDTQKPSAKHNSFRPVGRLLHDLGLELVREQVYRDLIDIQAAKDAKNQLDEREKGQLLKLVEAQDRLAVRNAPYVLTTKRCSHCSFITSSANALLLHQQFGTVSRIDASMHVCCVCSGQASFRTRSALQFMAHLSEAHGLTGRLVKKAAIYACKNCPFEHKSSIRMAVHVEKCNKKFSLANNLLPLPGDCDIPLIFRLSDRNLAATSPSKQQASSSSTSFAATGPPSVRTLLNSLRHQLSGQHSGFSHSQPVIPSLICEICGKLVDSRDALWSHFRCAHHVELCRTTMRDKEPWMKCDVCSGRFWTYQGLSRHLLLAHNRALASSFVSGTAAAAVAAAAAATSSSAGARCHLCGGSQTSNPLTHFSAYHNVTLLEMYHAKLCCLCNRKVNSGRAFEQHMVEQHSDIFANYDVLRTVLQALTTARYFKDDDTREPTMQSIRQLTANAGHTGTAVHSNSKKKRANAIEGASIAVHRRNSPTTKKATTPSNHSITSALKDLQSSQSEKEPRSVASPRAGDNGKAATNITTEIDFLQDGVKHISAAATMTQDRQESLEEVKKLYEDLGDLGRPLLRSMRRKLSYTSGNETFGTMNAVTAKKLHLQSSDDVNS